MLETELTSASQTVVIGPERAFVIIGERINPTGRSKLAEEMLAGDFSRVEADALAQVAAGAQMLDVNAGVPMADEPALLAEAIRVVQSVTDVPLAIDSSVVPALEAGLAAYEGKPLVNSVTGEEERLDVVLPMVAEHGAAVIGIANDETGISEDPKERFRVAAKIVERAEAYGIPASDVIIDPLLMPAGAVDGAARQVFDIVGMVRSELGCNTSVGASNLSFGLPNRHALNATFLPMAITAGMTAAIANPCEERLVEAIRAAEVMMGRDTSCMAWLAANRAADGGGRRRRRRGTAG